MRRNKTADKARLRDPAVRAAICKEAAALASGASDGNFGISLPKSSIASEEGEEEGPGNLNCCADGAGALARMFINNARFLFRWSADGEPSPELSAETAARREGRPVAEVLYDWLCEEGCEAVLAHYFMNFAKHSLDDTEEMLTHPRTVPGLGDAGAHLGFLSDAGSHTYLLAHWVRDSGRLSMEQAVKLHTKDTADLFGMTDRGTVEVGRRADLNIIDLKQLRVLRPRFVRDLPTGAARWVQYTDGYTHTLCAGVVTHREGEATGALPGRLVRNPFATRRRPPPRYATLRGRAAMVTSTLRWEVEHCLIFRMLLGLLGAPTFERLGRMRDAKPPRRHSGGAHGSMLSVIALVAVALLAARHLQLV